MGQALVITVKRRNKTLAKIYYQWSGYTVSALYEAGGLIGSIEDYENVSDKELQLQLIRICEENGGGILGGAGSSEFEWISGIFPDERFKEKDISRDNGVIVISENGMKIVQKWSEGEIIIDLDTYELSNYVYDVFSSIEEYNGYRMHDCNKNGKLKVEDIPEIKYNLQEISIYDLDDLINALENLKGDVCQVKGRIYELISC